MVVDDAVEPVVEEHELGAPARAAAHEHVGGVRVAVDVAVDEDHLGKRLGHEPRHVAAPQPEPPHGVAVGDLNPFHELHREDPLAGPVQEVLWDDDLRPHGRARGREVGGTPGSVGGLVLKVELLGEVLLDLVDEPLVVEVGEEPADHADEPLDGRHVDPRHAPQPRVLDLHRERPPVVVARHVHLCEGSARHGLAADLGKQLLGVRAEVLLDRGSDLLPRADGALVQEVLPHRHDVFLREKVIQLPHVLAQLDINSAVLKAKLQKPISTTLMASLELISVIFRHPAWDIEFVIIYDSGSCENIAEKADRNF
mmetsp:Transcript_33405/g.79192  ORF Transcript_33405/g.79192 Transcript_33405/m.79192 type:complete len:312 (+) Transcript_33405:633-1568(+)